MKKISGKKVYSGGIIDVFCDEVLLENGRKTHRDVVVHNDAVAIVAVDNDNTLLVVEQYRYPVKEKLLEIPAGIIDEGEEPLAAAKRELKEETGYVGDKWRLLTSIYTSPGCLNEKIYIFLASDIRKVSDQSLDDTEILTYKKVKLDSIISDINMGKVNDAKTIAGVLMMQNQKGII